MSMEKQSRPEAGQFGASAGAAIAHPGVTAPLDRAAALRRKIDLQSARVGIIGLGYVGLPLALTFAERGFSVLGFDVDPAKIASLEAGRNYIRHLHPDRLTR